MKTRILIVLLLAPPCLISAFAAVGVDPVAKVQRIAMMANETTIISNQVTQIAEMQAQLTQLTEQYEHLREQALGTVGALTEPFTKLASQSTTLIGSGLTWKDEFSGIPGELAAAVEDMGTSGKSFRESWAGRLSAADTVTESDILSLYGNVRPEIGTRAAEGFRVAREEGDKRLVSAHTLADAAAELMVAVKEARASYQRLQNNTNVSGTALAQSQVAGTVTQGHLTVAMAQLMAFEAARQAAEDYEREIARREELERSVEMARQAEINFEAQQAGLDQRRDSLREGLLFRIHPLYGGNGP